MFLNSYKSTTSNFYEIFFRNILDKFLKIYYLKLMGTFPLKNYERI